MQVIQNNVQNKPKQRYVWCTHCHSQLGITDADIKQVEGRNAVLCPCCQSHFSVMTEAETVEAYYQK